MQAIGNTPLLKLQRLSEPGGTVVEYTGGSTGSSLAMVCAKKGYRAHFVSSDAFAKEKLHGGWRGKKVYPEERHPGRVFGQPFSGQGSSGLGRRSSLS
jgi:hypothetical protein